MGQLVIAAYRPHDGREEDLLGLLREHLSALREKGFVTDRPSIVMRAAGGTLLEIFEWKSGEAVDQAHHDEVVQRLWERFAEVCDYESLANLEESQRPFPHFDPVDL